MKDKLYPLLTYLVRITYPFGIGKVLHFILRKLNLLSNPMNYKSTTPNYGLALMQFEKLQENLNHRKKIAFVYTKLINPKILSPKIFQVLTSY